MLFLCDLPVDTEATDNEETKTPNSKKKFIIIGSISAFLSMVIIVCIVWILNLEESENISPYCLLTKNENRICKIHDKKHDTKDLDELIIPKEEMAFHEQLFNEVSQGAYFDGKRLYKEEDAKEILVIQNQFNKEKASLFEDYLASTLKDEEKARYNFVIAELAAIDEAISKLGIQKSDEEMPNQEDLIKEVENLKKELEKVKSTSQEGYIQQLDALETNGTIQEEQFIYNLQDTTQLQIPANIEETATIKKSSLYKNQ